MVKYFWVIKMVLYDLITDWEWITNPTNYGWFHLLWLGIMLVECLLFALVFAKRHDKKLDDKIIFGFGSMLILLEIYKQVFLTLEAGYYQWYQFPFQFCSVPMYVAFLAPLCKKEKVKNSMYLFLSSFGLLAGFVVMAYPDNLFASPYITIAFHTMFWHSSMVVMGVYLIVSRKFGKHFKEIVPGLSIFLVIVLIALVVNIVAYEIYFKFPEKNIHDETFFLLYISPYYDTPLPILSDIKKIVPFPVFLIIYIMVFSLGVSMLWGMVIGIRKLFCRKKEVNIT